MENLKDLCHDDLIKLANELPSETLLSLVEQQIPELDCFIKPILRSNIPLVEKVKAVLLMLKHPDTDIKYTLIELLKEMDTKQILEIAKIVLKNKFLH